MKVSCHLSICQYCLAKCFYKLRFLFIIHEISLVVCYWLFLPKIHEYIYWIEYGDEKISSHNVPRTHLSRLDFSIFISCSRGKCNNANLSGYLLIVGISPNQPNFLLLNSEIILWHSLSNLVFSKAMSKMAYWYWHLWWLNYIILQTTRTKRNK